MVRNRTVKRSKQLLNRYILYEPWQVKGKSVVAEAMGCKMESRGWGRRRGGRKWGREQRAEALSTAGGEAGRRQGRGRGRWAAPVAALDSSPLGHNTHCCDHKPSCHSLLTFYFSLFTFHSSLYTLQYKATSTTLINFIHITILRRQNILYYIYVFI